MHRKENYQNRSPSYVPNAGVEALQALAVARVSATAWG